MPAQPTPEDLKALVEEARDLAHKAYHKTGIPLCTQPLGSREPWVRHLECAEAALTEAIAYFRSAEHALPSCEDGG